MIVKVGLFAGGTQWQGRGGIDRVMGVKMIEVHTCPATSWILKSNSCVLVSYACKLLAKLAWRRGSSGKSIAIVKP
jgi:hypothetical protein